MNLAKPRLGAGRADPHHGNDLTADTATELERVDYSTRTGRCANEKALLLPITISNNPHQRQLTAPLERLRVKIAFANPASARPLLSPVAHHAPVGTRRLHWTHRFTTADGRLRSVKAVCFIMERAP